MGYPLSMFLDKLIELKKELAQFNRSEVIFILCSMLCGFFICADYSLVRPISNAIFITAYGAKAFPYAWLALAPFSLLIITVYNRLLPKFSCSKLLSCIIAVIVIGNLSAVFLLKRGGSFPFIYYIWKDVYVLLLFQQLWAMIHATVSLKRAHFLYGILFAAGALGGVFGSLIPGFFALKMGSETLLIFSAPILFTLLLLYTYALKHSRIDSRLPPTESRGVQQGLKQIAGSRVLLFILLIVIFMQTASTLLDFQFNTSLQAAISMKDLRTEYTGRVMSLVNIISFSIQLGGGFLLLTLLGLKRAHLIIPMILLSNAILSMFFPLFSIVTLSFITIKAFDFSLFTIVKEMLYIPLKTEEKFHAKSVIDVFAYRSAKAIAAIMILFTPFLSGILLFIFVIWIAAGRYFFTYDQNFSYYTKK